MGKNTNEKVFLLKWDYKYFNVNDLVLEKDGKGFVECGYGRKYKYSINEEKRLKDLKKPSYTEINEKSVVYVYFYNIPGSSNQIYLKLTNLEFKDNEKYYTLPYDLEEKNEKTGKKEIVKYIQRCFRANKVEWVVDEKNPVRFTREGLIDYNVEERPSLQMITDDDNNNLVSDLDKYSNNTYSSMKNKMSKMGECYFKEHRISNEPSTYHETFINKFGLPYLEQHHLVLQEEYRNNKDKQKELYKLVYSNNNQVLLCPRCHRMIHQANEEERRQMINILMKDKKYKETVENVSKVLNVNTNDLLEKMHFEEFK